MIDTFFSLRYISNDITSQNNQVVVKRPVIPKGVTHFPHLVLALITTFVFVGLIEGRAIPLLNGWGNLVISFPFGCKIKSQYVKSATSTVVYAPGLCWRIGILVLKNPWNPVASFKTTLYRFTKYFCQRYSWARILGNRCLTPRVSYTLSTLDMISMIHHESYVALKYF